MNRLHIITGTDHEKEKEIWSAIYFAFKKFIENMPEDSPAGIQVKQELIDHFLKDKEE